MCLATVATCSHCGQEFCCALNICAEAKRLGIIHLAKSIPDTRPAIEIANPQTDIHFLKVYQVMEQERIQVMRCSRCERMSGLKPGLLRAEEAQQQRATNELANALDAYFGFDVHLLPMILPKLKELSNDTNCLKRENMALKKDNLILKKGHNILRRDIYQLKSSQIFGHVGEHDDRLDDIDEELDDLKAVIEKHSKRIQHYEGLGNVTEKMQIDDLNATLEDYSKRIEQLKCLEGAMEKMKIDKTREDAADEAEWEYATFTE